METTATRGVMLQSGDVENLKQVPQLIFGQLVKLCAATITHYHSDLYWDAKWITDFVTGTETVTFWFAYDENGTHIGFDDLVKGSRKNTVRATVTLADRTARMMIEPVTV